jgi:hypothetical protein
MAKTLPDEDQPDRDEQQAFKLLTEGMTATGAWCAPGSVPAGSRDSSALNWRYAISYAMSGALAAWISDG